MRGVHDGASYNTAAAMGAWSILNCSCIITRKLKTRYCCFQSRVHTSPFTSVKPWKLGISHQLLSTVFPATLLPRELGVTQRLNSLGVCPVFPATLLPRELGVTQRLNSLGFCPHYPHLSAIAPYARRWSNPHDTIGHNAVQYTQAWSSQALGAWSPSTIDTASVHIVLS
jgi:hypothetical protein